MRLNSMDYLRLTNDPKWIDTFLLVATDPKDRADVKKYAQYCVLQHRSWALLEKVDKRLRDARNYMASVNRGEEKYDSEKMNKANEASNVLQIIMTAINNGMPRDSGEILKIKRVHDIRTRTPNRMKIMPGSLRRA